MYFITKGDDLRKVVVLLKSMSTGAKTLIVSSRNLTDYGKAKSSHTATKVAGLREGSFVSTGHKTKIQNFHSEGNFQAFFVYDAYFLNKGKYLFYRIDHPKFEIDKKELLEAVAFEFGIKYFDRVFDELKQKALGIFSVKYDQFC